jgi:hypothetical protein
MNWLWQAILDDLTSPPLLIGAVAVVVAAVVAVVARKR